MQRIIVSDGFYSNPEQMKMLFSTLDYGKNENFLQGLMCPLKYANIDMLKQIEYLINVPEDSFEFIDGSGSFVINRETDVPSQKICINLPDPNTHWVGVVCLNEDVQSRFLSFYKHKRTGWYSVPQSIEEAQKENINSYEDFGTFMMYENQDWEQKWEETTRIEYKFNQLILFRPGMFHSYSDVYGDTQENGRLLQFFFLRPKIVPEQQ